MAGCFYFRYHSTINVLSVPNMNDRDNPPTIFNIINYAVVAYPYPPPITGSEFQASVRARVLRKIAYCITDALIGAVRQLRQFLLRTP